MFKYTKDSVSVFTVLDTRRPKADGKYPVKVQVGFARKQKYYTTSKTLSVEEWRKLPTTKLRSLVQVREEIEARFNIVRDFVRDLTDAGNFSFYTLNMRLNGATAGTINTAFEAKIERLKQAERVGTMWVYKTTLNSIERFAGKSIPFSDVTPKWLQEYENHQREIGRNTTSISITMRTLRAIISEAKHCGIIRPVDDPFNKGKYEIKNGHGRKLALTLEQIGQISRYDDGTETTAKYRDYWLFLYLCNGINVADFIRLKFKNIENGEICFTRQKTERTSREEKTIRAIVTPPMQAVIDRWGNPPKADNYIFPILTGKEDAFRAKLVSREFITKINLRMKRIGEAIGVGKITTYAARHSFATVLKRAGANIAYISESLGHQDLKTTENYLASFEREERQKNAELLTKF